MHLKKLHLQGFKTFADKTDIEFSEGVTAIVGPNGSGKSNIADAVLWVLGEQKPSAMRGSQARDVIFSGSEKRRATGMAEVSLTVDNSDGRLPLAFNEVTITRRAYRTGEGEFFINKTPCRLKDIYELFLDSGVGRDAYSLVNQGEIDAVLSVNPEDRRGLFEEAAGIKKYRVKKREALRKLESTDANLQRVHDILGEISGRLEPLAEQAEIAKRYVEVRDRLASIEQDLLIIDLRSTTDELNAARKAREEQQAVIGGDAERIAAAEERAEEIAGKISEIESLLDSSRREHQEALTRAERAESATALSRQRAEGLASSLELLTQELEGLTLRERQFTDGQDELQAELAGDREEEARLRASVAERQAAADELSGRVSQLIRQGERRRAEALEIARKQANRQAELTRTEARVAELEAAFPALQTEAAALETAVKAQSDTVQQELTEAEQNRTALDASDQRVTDALRLRDTTRQAVETARSRSNTVAGERVGISTRLRTLSDLEQAQEGYYAGVKAVFDAKKRGNLKGEFTVVADAFQSPPGYEVALETALGGSLQDIITDSEAEAKAAIDYLYQARAGRATFLPLNRMRPSRDGIDLGRARGKAGVLGGALDIVQYDRRFAPALDVLLGRILICETLDDALAASKEARGWGKIVTLTGELILPSGAMSGGRQAGRGAAHLLGRKTEIATLQMDLQDKDRAVETCKAELATAERKRDEAEQALNEAYSAKQATQLAVADARRRAESARAESNRLAQAQTQAIRRVEAAEHALRQAKNHALEAAAALASGGAETADVDQALSSESEEVRRFTEQRDALAAELTAARVALATISEKVVSLDRALRNAKGEIEQIRLQHMRKVEQRRIAQTEYDSLLTQRTDREADTVHAREAAEALAAKVGVQNDARQQLVHQSQHVSGELRRFAEERANALDIVHKQELKEARLEIQRTQIAARLFDEYEVTEEQALALADDPVVTSGSPTEVARLRRELRQMGDVNTGAIEEYEETSTRFEFLTAQRADLDEAKEKLLDAIRDIDASTREVFLDTLAAVSEAFAVIFARLFGGGKTELVLTNPDDLLETGIDILVQPPGKKRQNLLLLSGGERALTAVALLFAFLKVKPSPFTVMDEVDAPLDGANVERFADLLREFGERSQFIIITHNPTTMEAAPVWYGITMQTAGVSSVLSMQVPHMPSANDQEEEIGRLTANGRKKAVPAAA